MSNVRVVHGHGLQAEGAAFRSDPRIANGQPYRVRVSSVGGRGFALCACGERSDVLDSSGDRKRWHYGHKEKVLASRA